MLTKNLINYYEALNNAGYHCMSNNSDIRAAMKEIKVISAHIDEISSCFVKGDSVVKFEENHPYYGPLTYPATFKFFISGDNSCHPCFNVNPPLSMRDWRAETFLEKIKIEEAYLLSEGDPILVFIHEGEAFFSFKGTVRIKNFREPTLAVIEP